MLIKFVVNFIALFVVEYLIPGFYLKDIWSGFVAAVVIGLANTVLRPILQIISLPITIMTVGLFALVINVALLYFCSLIVPGFDIINFQTAILASIALSFISWFLNRVIKD